MISIIFFSLFRINRINKTNLMLMLLSSIALFYIYSVRYWVALSIIISVLTYITIKFIRIFFKNKTYQVSFLLIITTFFVLLYSEIFNFNSHIIYIEIFERIKVEHFFPPEDYEKLFIHFIRDGMFFADYSSKRYEHGPSR